MTNKNKNNFAYVMSKIAHMRRLGVVTGNSSGIGMNGGACPDWLAKEQKDRAEKHEPKSYTKRVLEQLSL